MGTLGLAWTGDLKNAGGVCEKNGVSKIFILKIIYRGSLINYVNVRMLNVFLITILRKKKLNTPHLKLFIKVIHLLLRI